MAAVVAADWPTCGRDGCTGLRLDADDGCLAHAGDQELATVLGKLSQTGSIDARGVTISGALQEKILHATPRDADGHPLLTEARFDGATFESDTNFEDATFERALFRDVTFQGVAAFGRANF